MNPKIIILSFVIFVTSCGGHNDDSKVDLQALRAVVLENQNKWNASDIIDYSFTYQIQPGDCPTADPLPARDINVENEMVVSVFVTGTSQVYDLSSAPTIDDIFTNLLDFINEQPLKFTSRKGEATLPTFDVNLGYPLNFYVDISENNCDATAVVVSNFR